MARRGEGKGGKDKEQAEEGGELQKYRVGRVTAGRPGELNRERQSLGGEQVRDGGKDQAFSSCTAELSDLVCRRCELLERERRLPKHCSRTDAQIVLSFFTTSRTFFFWSVPLFPLCTPS